MKFKVRNRKFEIPDNWDQVSYKQWLEIQAASKEESVVKIISALTGLDIEQIESFGDAFLVQLMPYIAWINSPVNPAEWKVPEVICEPEIIVDGKTEIIKTSPFDFIKPPKDIREKSFAQKIFIQQAVKKFQTDNDLNDCILESVAIYLQPLIENKTFDYEAAVNLKSEIAYLPLKDIYALGNDYINQLIKVVEIEGRELKGKVKNEQVRAGINMFDQFGVNNIIDSLAGGDILKYEQVLQMDYNVVFLKLKRSKLEGIYHDNYNKVLEEKYKRK